MSLHFIKFVPNNKNASFPSSGGNPCQCQAVAALRNEPFDWDSTRSDLLMVLSTAQKLHLVTLQDTSPSHQNIKGQVTKVAKGQTSQLHLLPLFIFVYFAPLL